MGHVTPGLHRSVNDQHESLNEWIEIELMCYKKKRPVSSSATSQFCDTTFQAKKLLFLENLVFLVAFLIF